MKPETITELIGISKRLVELYSEGLTGISCHSLSAHLDEAEFKETFAEYEARRSGVEDYPFRLSTWVDGVEFFCLCGKEDTYGI